MKEILRFRPILKQTLWGGEKIIPFKGMDLALTNVGESWELSGVAGNETTVVDMPDMTLNQLVSVYGPSLLGRKNHERFGNEFPLLIKFIDARENLSIQVHPDDETARRQGKARGKTEMWYLMESAPDATLYSGLKQRITPEQYKMMVADGSICDALAQYQVAEDNVFFLPAGRIHAIGAGCFLAEIQQTSDVTYRIYDFNRCDKDGNCRQLHTMEAAESGLYETIQFPFSYLAGSKELELVETCRKNGVGFIAMKGLAGDLINNSKAAMAFMSQFDNVMPIWGIQRMSELEEWLSYMDSTPQMDSEISAFIDKEQKELSGDFCRGCGYCMPCTVGIQINQCARMSLMLRRAPSDSWLSPHWQEEMNKIDNCVNCRLCASRCPYELDTPNLLRKNLADYRNVLAGRASVQEHVHFGK